MKHAAFIPDLLMMRLRKLAPGEAGDIRSAVSRDAPDRSAHRKTAWLYEDLLA